MSDANKAPGDPIEDPRPEGDVVGSANEGLAEAEAAQRDIVVEPAAPAEPVEVIEVPAGSASSVYSDSSPTTVYADDAATTAYATPVEPPVAVVASEPVVPVATAAASTSAPQPIFVQAPEAPTPRGNRAAVGAIGLLAALSFAVLYLACALGFGLLDGSLTLDTVADAAIAALTSWWLWVTTGIFFIGFWLIGAIINRGRWAHWVVWGLLIGFVGYGAHLVGQLFQAPFWQLTRSEGAELVETQLVAPLAFAAFVIARELTIWFGAWAAARGTRVTELNIEARREYERTLEAGPQLVRR